MFDGSSGPMGMGGGGKKNYIKGNLSPILENESQFLKGKKSTQLLKTVGIRPTELDLSRMFLSLFMLLVSLDSGRFCVIVTKETSNFQCCSYLAHLRD